jgi:hypothetical protein
MSRFSSLWAAGVPLFEDQLGTPAVYLPATGPPKPIRVIEQAESTEIEETNEGLQQRHVKTISIPRGQVLDPQRNAQIRLAATLWAIHRIVSRTENVTAVELVRRMPVELSREGYRGSAR